MAIKKGDRLKYVGPYAPEVLANGAGYSPGTVVGFRNNRFHGRCVTVLLDDKSPYDGSDLYADWPISMVEPEPAEQTSVQNEAQGGHDGQ